MRFLLLFALAFHMTLGPVCMMHTAYAAEHDHVMMAHELSMESSSDCPDCFAAHEPTTHDSSCANGCVSVQEPDLLTFAPQILEMPVAIMPTEGVSMEIGLEPIASLGETLPIASPIPLQSVVLLL